MIETMEQVLHAQEIRSREQLMMVLKNEGFMSISKLPVSLVSHQSKLKYEADENITFFGEAGESKEVYTLSELQKYSHVEAKLFQTLDLALVETLSGFEQLHFKSKRVNDYWKRLINIEGLSSMLYFRMLEPLECLTKQIDKELQSSVQGQWHVEQSLRDDMRSKKENPELRAIAYSVLFCIDAQEVEHIEGLLQHYFGTQYLVVRHPTQTLLYAYSKSLDAISLREFYKKR